MIPIAVHPYKALNPRYTNKKEEEKKKRKDRNLIKYNSIQDLVKCELFNNKENDSPMQRHLPHIISSIDERLESLKSYASDDKSKLICSLTEEGIFCENKHNMKADTPTSKQVEVNQSNQQALAKEKFTPALINKFSEVCNKDHKYLKKYHYNLEGAQTLLLQTSMNLPDQHSPNGLTDYPVTSLRRTVSEKETRGGLASLRTKRLFLDERFLAESIEKTLETSPKSLAKTPSNDSLEYLADATKSSLFDKNVYQTPSTSTDSDELISISNEIIHYISYNDRNPNRTPSPQLYPPREFLMEPSNDENRDKMDANCFLKYTDIRGPCMRSITNPESTISGNGQQEGNEYEYSLTKSFSLSTSSPVQRNKMQLTNILEKMSIKNMLSKKRTSTQPARINQVLSFDTSFESSSSGKRQEQPLGYRICGSNDNGTDTISPILIVSGKDGSIPLVSSSHEVLLKNAKLTSSSDFIPQRPVPTTPSTTSTHVLVSKVGTGSTSSLIEITSSESNSSRLTGLSKKIFRNHSLGEILRRNKKSIEKESDVQLDFHGLEIDEFDQPTDIVTKMETMKQFLKSDVTEDEQVVGVFKKLLDESF